MDLKTKIKTTNQGVSVNSNYWYASALPCSNKALVLTCITLRFIPAAQLGRYIAKYLNGLFGSLPASTRLQS